MKCPFQTIKKVREIHYATRYDNGSYDETTEFMDCVKDECPYYGKTVLQHRAMGGFESVKVPCCRRADS